MADTWGCHSAHGHERCDWYWVQDGWMTAEVRRMVMHKDTGSIECQYRKGTPDDPKCAGCSKP